MHKGLLKHKTFPIEITHRTDGWFIRCGERKWGPSSILFLKGESMTFKHEVYLTLQHNNKILARAKVPLMTKYPAGMTTYHLTKHLLL